LALTAVGVLSAVGLVNLEELIISGFSPLVAGEIAVVFYIGLRGRHNFTSSVSLEFGALFVPASSEFVERLCAM
jgi:hypothetical protein